MSQLLPSFKKQSDIYQTVNSPADGGLTTNDVNVKAGLKQVHQLLYPSLFWYVTAMLRNKTKADELIMELFVAVWNDKNMAMSLMDLQICLFKAARTIAVTSLKQTRFSDLEELLFDQPVIEFIADDVADYTADHDKKLIELNRCEPLQREVICLQWCGFDLYQISLITGKLYKSILNF